MNKIIAIVGMCGSGKSIASSFLEKNGFKNVYLGGITMKKMQEENIEITPDNEKKVREKLRETYGMGAYAVLSLPEVEKLLIDNNVVIDGLYSWDELKIFKEKYQENFKVLSIVCNKEIRYSRLETRSFRPLTKTEAEKRDLAEIENLAKGGPIAYADYYILNNDDITVYNQELEKLIEKI